jgi:hypothetical protein
MKKLLFAATAAAALVSATPASAQLYIDADPWGTAVQIGPFGFGVGPRYDYRPGWYDGYYYDGPHTYGTTGYNVYVPGDCRLMRERVVLADGRVIFRTRREC